MKRAIIDKKVKHQKIGGKEITLEKEFTYDDILDWDLKKMNIAMYNFIMRRPELDEDKGSMKIYYGHVENFGYFVAEDEIEMIKNE